MILGSIKCALVFPGPRSRTTAEWFCYTAPFRARVMYTHNLLHFARHWEMMNL
jgi:hypothetical protein